MRLTFTIPGDPHGQARPRSFARCPKNVALCAAGKCRPFTSFFPSPGDKEWRARVLLAVKASGSKVVFADVPVGVSIRFIGELPKSHQRAKPTPRRWSLVRPDLDNLQKGVWDALVADGWIVDDNLIARAVSEKVVGAQGEPPRTVVSVFELEPIPVEVADGSRA